MIIKNLNRAYVRMGYAGCGEIILASEQIHSVYIEIGNTFAIVFYAAVIFNLYSGHFLQGILQGHVAFTGKICKVVDYCISFKP